jgi:hypothetical protein
MMLGYLIKRWLVLEDSNLQPDRYERASVAENFCKIW